LLNNFVTREEVSIKIILNIRCFEKKYRDCIELPKTQIWRQFMGFILEPFNGALSVTVYGDESRRLSSG
jgi:hypothetical protein